MFLKSLILIVFIAAVAVVLLGFRQQRLQMMNEMVHLHAKIDQSRQDMWDLQVKIADRIDPPMLAQAIERAQLKLEPTTATPTAPPNGKTTTPADVHRASPAGHGLPQHQMTDARPARRTP